MKYLAFDLVASSGKLLLGEFDGSVLKLSEIHKFPNRPVNMGRGTYWDYFYIYSGMIEGIQKASSLTKFVSMGIDGYCNDFSFINGKGDLLYPVRSYRDLRTKRYSQRQKAGISDERLYSLTGNLSTLANTRMQLAAMVEEGQGYLFEHCDKMLFLPDLLLYYLSGEKVSELTLSSVSQLMNYKTQKWEPEIMKAFSIPGQMMGEIVKPGTVIGKKQPAVQGLEDVGAFDLTTVCEHDTASAFSSFLYSKDEVLVSSGTWMLCGVPVDVPSTGADVMKKGITNEGNMDGKYFLVKSIMGTWLIQEVIRDYRRKGYRYEFSQIDEMICNARPFAYRLDVDDEELFNPGNMIHKIRKKCFQLNGKIPETPGEIFRCIQECMAFKCRQALEELQEETGREFSRIHILDGGAKDTNFCRYLANVCNKEVCAGLDCASAAGNILVQMAGHGEISSMKEGYEILRNSFRAVVYKPDQPSLWEEKYLQYQEELKNLYGGVSMQ